jgi:uncharacterized membrane protein
LTLDSNKNLAGIGAILVVIGLAGIVVEPFIIPLSIVGVIMLLFGIRGLADYYKEKEIFTNALSSFIVLVVGAIVVFAAFTYIFIYTPVGTGVISAFYTGFNGDWTNLPNLTPNPNITSTDLLPYIGPLYALLAILCVFASLASYFAWRSLKTLAKKANVGLLSTAGLILFIGAILTSIFIGFLLMWLAFLLIAVAIYQIKPVSEPSAEAPPAAPITPTV